MVLVGFSTAVLSFTLGASIALLSLDELLVVLSVELSEELSRESELLIAPQHPLLLSADNVSGFSPC